MDGQRFDALTKALATATSVSRRRVVGGLIGSIAAGAIARVRPPATIAQERPPMTPGAGANGPHAASWLTARPVLEYFALGDSIASGHGLGDDDGPEPSRIRRGYDGGVCADCDGPACRHCEREGVCGPCRDAGCSAWSPWCDPAQCGTCRDDLNCRPCCRRSERSYPARARDLLAGHFTEVRFHHLACTSASSLTPDRLKADLISPDPAENGPIGHRTPLRLLRTQVDEVVASLDGIPTDRPVLVSITIGANDFEFADGVELVNRLYRQTDEEFDRWALHRAGEVKNEVGREVRRLLADTRVVVVLTEVHNPFNEASVFFTGLNDCLGKTCYDRTDRGVGWLNERLRAVVDETGAEPGLDAAGRIGIARIHEEFEKRASPRPTCGDAGPDVDGPGGERATWIQYRNDPDSTSFAVPDFVGFTRLLRQSPLTPVQFRLLDLVVRRVRQGEWRGDCFHPNDEGAAYIAERVAAVARPLLDGVSAGLA